MKFKLHKKIKINGMCMIKKMKRVIHPADIYSKNSIIIMLMKVKMLTAVGILTFMSRINFMHIRIEHENIL